MWEPRGRLGLVKSRKETPSPCRRPAAADPGKEDGPLWWPGSQELRAHRERRSCRSRRMLPKGRQGGTHAATQLDWDQKRHRLG